MGRTRLDTGAVILNGQGPFTDQSFTPVTNIMTNGQWGFAPDYHSILSNSAYARRPVIPVLLEYPRGFDFLPYPEAWIATLKSLIETQSKNIDGLTSTVNVENAEFNFGAAGEFQQDLTRVTRARSQPKHTWVERQGQPIRNFLEGWIFYLMAHPDTQTPMIHSLPENRDRYFDFLPDFNSMSVLYIEPDPFHRRVVDAWLCVNMRPNTGGEVTANRDITSGFQTREIDVEFTAITITNKGVKQFAQEILNRMNHYGFNPQNRQSVIQSISKEIEAAKNFQANNAVHQPVGEVESMNRMNDPTLTGYLRNNPYSDLTQPAAYGASLGSRPEPEEIGKEDALNQDG